MIRTRNFLFLLAGGALALALAAPLSADVGLGAGDAAIDFEGKDFVNTDPVSLKSLRGRIVLLELFSTT